MVRHTRRHSRRQSGGQLVLPGGSRRRHSRGRRQSGGYRWRNSRGRRRVSNSRKRMQRGGEPAAFNAQSGVGPYMQYESNVPLTYGYSTGGVKLGPMESGLANPAPISRYNHCKDADGPSESALRAKSGGGRRRRTRHRSRKHRGGRSQRGGCTNIWHPTCYTKSQPAEVSH